MSEETGYSEEQKKQEEYYEGLCLRCGACCGANDGDPCRNLARGRDNKYYCKVYEHRVGQQFTLSGKSFACVPIREIFQYESPYPQCAYFTKPKGGIIALLIFLACAFPLYAQEQPAEPEQEQVTQAVEVYPYKSLVQAAWEAFNAKEYASALSRAERCIAIYDTRAKELQASLHGPIPEKEINTYWALNDVATAKFIKGKILLAQRDKAGAKKALSDVVENYRYAMAFDVRGWHWSVSRAAADLLKAIDLGVDFEDSSSSLLVGKAWNALNNKQYQDAISYAEQCIAMYQEAAIWQQKSLTKYPKKKEDIEKYWALNDVGTSYYIAGKSYRELKQPEKAREYFNFIKKNLFFASCLGERGQYWNVADAVK